MKKKDFAALKASLQDAIAYLNGDKSRGRATVIDVAELDVGVIRNKVGLSQDDFASAFGVSVGTLRNWEQGRNRPDGPARALLTVIDRDPAAVLKALRIAPRPRKVGSLPAFTDGGRSSGWPRAEWPPRRRSRA